MRRVALIGLSYALGLGLIVGGLTPVTAGAEPAPLDSSTTTTTTAPPSSAVSLGDAAVVPVPADGSGPISSDGFGGTGAPTPTTLPIRQQTTASAQATVSASSFACPGAGGSPAVGSGASFPQIVIDQWRADVSKLCGLKIDYQPNGSTAGRTNFINNAVDFGVSDIQFSASELTSLKRAFAYIPITAGGLGMMYNLLDSAGRKITDLRLSANTACKIFTGQIDNWNDAQIAADNNGRQLKSAAIRPVIRSDGSGTSYFFSQYCIDLVPEVWKKFAGEQGIANGPTSSWPTGWGNSRGANGSDGCANLVANPVTGKDSITAVEAGFALQRGMPNAFMKNNSGAYVQPTFGAVTAALGFATANADGTQKLNFRAPGAALYNPSSYSYLIAQTTGFSPAKGKTVAAFVQYSVLDGQKKANSLGYAALPTNLVALALNNAEKIPGAPPRPKDAPPPDAAVQPGQQIGGGGGTTPITARSRSTQVAGAQATNTAAAGPATPGPLGTTGSDAIQLVPVGAGLIGLGEWVRRRTKRRA